MSYLRLPSEAFDRLLDKDPKIIQMDICDYVIHLKKSGIIAPRSIQAYLAAFHKFYVMNDVTQLNWTKIHSFLGENEKQTEDRPYTHSEIQLLIQKKFSRICVKVEPDRRRAVNTSTNTQSLLCYSNH
jgi:hypothetical protein